MRMNKINISIVDEKTLSDYKETFRDLLNGEKFTKKNTTILSYLKCNLSDEKNFDMTLSIEFYNKTLDYLFNEKVLDGRLDVLNHELVHAAVALGFKYPPSIIIAKGLVIKFKSISINNDCLTLPNKSFYFQSEKNKRTALIIDDCYIGKTSSFFYSTIWFALPKGICFFENEFKSHIKTKDLVWMLMTAPHMDHLLSIKNPTNLKLKKRKIEIKIDNPNKKKKLNDLTRALKLVDSNTQDTANQLMDELKTNYDALFSKKTNINRGLEEFRRIINSKKIK